MKVGENWNVWRLAVKVVPPGNTCRQWLQRRLALGGTCPPPSGLCKNREN